MLLLGQRRDVSDTLLVQAVFSTSAYRLTGRIPVAGPMAGREARRDPAPIPTDRSQDRPRPAATAQLARLPATGAGSDTSAALAGTARTGPGSNLGSGTRTGAGQWGRPDRRPARDTGRPGGVAHPHRGCSQVRAPREPDVLVGDHAPHPSDRDTFRRFEFLVSRSLDNVGHHERNDSILDFLSEDEAARVHMAFGDTDHI